MSRRIILVDIGSGLTLSGVLPSVLLYDDYAATLKTRGGQPPYVYTLASGALPDGLSLDRATGIINGTTSEAGSFSFVVRVTDLSGAFVDRPFVIAVTAEPLTLSGNAPDGTLAVAYAYSYTPAGGVPPRTYSIVSGALPDGVSLNTSTGALSGTPTAGGSFAWVVRVADSDGASFDLDDSANVAYATLTLSGTFDDATVGVAYSSDLTITGGDGSYGNERVTVGSLPAWATLSIVSGKLRLSGTPTGSSTTVSITVAVDSGDGQTATSAQSVVVNPALPVVSLLRFAGADGSAVFYDEVLSFWTARGAARLRTTKGTPFGSGSSGYFSASGDYAEAISNSILDFGSGDFTVRAWVYVDGPQGAAAAIIGKHVTDGTSVADISWLFFSNSGKLAFQAYTTTGDITATDPSLLTVGAWRFVEACRKGSNLMLFNHGVKVATAAIGTKVLKFSNTINLTIGSVVKVGSAEPGLGWNGYIGECVVINGVALHDADYTPPTGPF